VAARAAERRAAGTVVEAVAMGVTAMAGVVVQTAVVATAMARRAVVSVNSLLRTPCNDPPCPSVSRRVH
jgi:hypothetical protein